MQLDTYIKQTIYSVLSGVKGVDEILKNKGLGSVWTGNLVTQGDALVNLHLAKGTDPDNPGDKNHSIPVIIFDYEVTVEVSDEKGDSDSASVEAGAKFLKVFTFGGTVQGNSEKRHAEKNGHALKFSIPVGMK